MWCSVNPAIREPELARLTPAADPGRVVVVGGGVAGLEAARGAALRGHHVVVFERRRDLGGRARLAAERRGRQRWRLYVDWLRYEAIAAGAEIRLGTSADVTAVLAEQPDAAILATGSRLRDVAPPSRTPLLDVDALLEHGLPAGAISRVLVIDDEGGFLAPTAAEALVAAGCTVEIATTHLSVGMLIDPTQQPFVLRRLALDGVVQSPNLAWVPAESSDVVELRNLYTEEVEHRADVDLVVVAGRRQSETSLKDALRTEAPELPVTLVGDALAPRTLLDAVAEGARAGAAIEIGQTIRIPDPTGGQESNLVGA
jgi:dimethylglycine catabolism A